MPGILCGASARRSLGDRAASKATASRTYHQEVAVRRAFAPVGRVKAHETTAQRLVLDSVGSVEIIVYEEDGGLSCSEIGQLVADGNRRDRYHLRLQV